MLQRLAASLVLVLAAACGSTAKSAEPTEPARDVGTTSAEPGEPDGTGTTAATLDPRLEAMITLMEHFVTAMEAAGGDCDRVADAITEFAHSDDGKAIRRAGEDPELVALADAQRDQMNAAHPDLEGRFRTVMNTCGESASVMAALDESEMFVKKRVDGSRDDD